METVRFQSHMGVLFLRETFFEKHKERILNELRHLEIRPAEKGFIQLTQTKNLQAKRDYELWSGTTTQTASSCTFCKKRIKCATNNFQCSTYDPIKGSFLSPEALEAFFLTIGATMLYAEVVR